MWKSCDGASKLVFLKFHQVGGGFVLSFIDALLKIFVHKHKQYPALRELARNRHDSVIISHVSSYEEVRTWIESDNQVPIGTCALTILRDPGERMVDTFFKEWFETDDDMGNAHQMAKKPRKNKWLNKALHIKVGKKRSWENTFNTNAVEHYWSEDPSHRPENLETERYSEYSFKLGKPKEAAQLLAQFNVVGVTEQHDDFLNRTCLALGVTSEDCATAKATASADTEHAHVYPEHPRMADFSSGFQELVKAGLAADRDIYESAYSLGVAKNAKRLNAYYFHRQGRSDSKDAAEDEDGDLGSYGEEDAEGEAEHSGFWSQFSSRRGEDYTSLSWRGSH